MLLVAHLLIVITAVLTGKLWIASSWTVLLLAYVSALAIHLKRDYWQHWSTGLGLLAVLYAAYTVSYLQLDFHPDTWTFAHHMRFVGWTGPLALIDAPIILTAVMRLEEQKAKRQVTSIAPCVDCPEAG